MENTQRFKITIAGESYFLVSDESEEHIRTVTQYVDDQIKQIAHIGKTDDIKRVAVLLALQCASKMMVSAEQLDQYEDFNGKLIELISQEMSRLSDA